MARTRLGLWYRSRTGLALMGMVKLGLVYLFTSLAINSGSLWQWALGLIFFFGALDDAVSILKMHKK